MVKVSVSSLHGRSKWRRVPVITGGGSKSCRSVNRSATTPPKEYPTTSTVVLRKTEPQRYGDGRDLDVRDRVSVSEWFANVGLSTLSQPTTRRRRCSKHLRCRASRVSIREAAFRPPSSVRRIQPYRDGTVIGEAYRHVGSEDPFFDRDIVCRQRVAKRFIECVRLVRYGGA